MIDPAHRSTRHRHGPGRASYGALCRAPGHRFEFFPAQIAQWSARFRSSGGLFDRGEDVAGFLGREVGWGGDAADHLLHDVARGGIRVSDVMQQVIGRVATPADLTAKEAGDVLAAVEQPAA